MSKRAKINDENAANADANARNNVANAANDAVNTANDAANSTDHIDRPTDRPIDQPLSIASGFLTKRTLPDGIYYEPSSIQKFIEIEI